MTASKPTPFVVGILVLPPIVQLVDISPVDKLNVLSKSWLTSGPYPEGLKKLAQDIEVHYIAPGGPGTHANVTTGTSLAVTDDLTSPAVAPGKLDLLYLPGALTFDAPSEDVQKFIRGHFNATCTATGRPTDVISVCASVIFAAYSGIFDGKTVACPGMGLDTMKSICPKANWVTVPFVNEGNLWSAWGSSGLNEVAHNYLRYQADELHRFPKELVDFAVSL